MLACKGIEAPALNPKNGESKKKIGGTRNHKIGILQKKEARGKGEGELQKRIRWHARQRGDSRKEKSRGVTLKRLGARPGKRGEIFLTTAYTLASTKGERRHRAGVGT